MKVGTSIEQRRLAQVNKALEDQIELKEGNNLLRIIQGPQKTKTVFVPVIVEKDDKLEQSYAVFNFIESGGILDSLYALELGIRRDLGEEKPDCGFFAKVNWFYLAINLQNSELKVQPVKLPNSIKKELQKLETDLDIKDPEYLRNGLMWMFDTLVEKIIDPKKSKRYGTSYKASVYGVNKFMGIVPAQFLNCSSQEILEAIGEGDINKGMVEVFGEELVPAIESCDLDLEEELKPLSEAEILSKLMKFTINLSAVNPMNGSFKFPQTPDFKEGIEALGLKATEFSEVDEVVENKPKAIKGGFKFNRTKPEEESKGPKTPKPQNPKTPSG